MMKMSNNGFRNRSQRTVLLLLIVVGIAIPQFSRAQSSSLRGGGDYEEEARKSDVPTAIMSDSVASPALTDCLLSAVNSNDCGTIVAGCIWCAEPIYGLCVTETAAKKMQGLPIFKCNLNVATIE